MGSFAGSFSQMSPKLWQARSQAFVCPPTAHLLAEQLDTESLHLPLADRWLLPCLGFFERLLCLKQHGLHLLEAHADLLCHLVLQHPAHQDRIHRRFCRLFGLCP